MKNKSLIKATAQVYLQTENQELSDEEWRAESIDSYEVEDELPELIKKKEAEIEVSYLVELMKI